MEQELRLPPPDEMLEQDAATPLSVERPTPPALAETPEPKPAVKRKAKAAPAAEGGPAPIDQSALNAAMQVLRAAGMEVVAKVAPKGPCPNDPDTGRAGYYQTTTDQNGRQHTVRVYSGFKEGEKGKRPDPVPTGRKG